MSSALDDAADATEDEPQQHSLERTDSVYDNNPVTSSQTTKPSTADLNDNLEKSTLEEKSDECSTPEEQDNSKSLKDSSSEHNTASEQEEDIDNNEQNLQSIVNDSYKAIDKVRDEIDGYRKEVDDFDGDKQCKQFRYLDEMLTRCQLSLDNIETHGNVDLRKYRKETVNQIDSLLLVLDNKCQPS